MSGDGFVTATFNYTAPMDVEPEFYLYEPDPGTVKRDPVQDPREMRVEDIRGREATSLSTGTASRSPKSASR